MIRKSRVFKKSLKLENNGKSFKKRSSTKRRLSKRIQINNQKGSGSNNRCCGCGRKSRKRRTIGPRPLGSSK